MKYRWMILMICCPSILWAQADEMLATYSEKYEGESIVTLEETRTLDISVNKEGKLDIYLENEETRFYLTEIAGQYSQASVPYSDFNQLEAIEAYSMVPSNGKFKKLKVKEFTTSDEFSSGVFHDDTKSKGFVYPSLVQGSKTHLYYKLKVTEPHLLSSIYLADFVNVEKLEHTIWCDKEVELAFDYINMEEKEIPMTREEKKGRIKYTWSLKDIEKYEYESNAPSAGYYMPHVVVRIRSYEHNGQRHNVLGSVSDLHDWYYSLIQNVNDEPSEELKAIVDSLIRDETSEIEKVRKIYYWVQDNIKYIAFEEGMGGFIPEEASEVMNNKYGDCKGMSSIIYEMLGMASIPSHITWVGTRDIPYRYEEAPSPVVDNHMIVTYKNDDRYYFLDATGNTTPLDHTASFIQGKEVLINMGERKFEVKEVPVDHYKDNAYIDTTKLTLAKGNALTGVGHTILTGSLQTSIRSVLKRRSEKEQKEFMDAYYEKGSNKFQLDSFEVKNLKDRDKALEILYTFDLPDYVRENGDELYVNMNLEKLKANSEIDDDRELAIEARYKSMDRLVTILDIPVGYKVDYMPENASFEDDRFGFTISYKEENGQIIHVLENYDNYLQLKKEDFEKWNKMIKKLRKNYNEVVILKKL